MPTTTTVGGSTAPASEPTLQQRILGNRLVRILIAVGVLSLIVLIGSAVTSAGEDPATSDAGTTRPSENVDLPELAPPITTQIIPPLPGATATSRIVPVGYPQTEPGAVAAATNYLTTLLGSRDMLNQSTRDPIIAAAVAPESQEQVRTDLGGIYDEVRALYGIDDAGVTADGGTVVMMLTPKTYRLDSYSPDRAVVSIWHDVVTGVSGNLSTNPPSARYATATVTLGWIDGDWKWLALDGVDGPTPTGASDTGGTDPVALDRVTTQWTRYTYGAGGTP